MVGQCLVAAILYQLETGPQTLLIGVYSNQGPNVTHGRDIQRGEV